jgi:hypothetical protein
MIKVLVDVSSTSPTRGKKLSALEVDGDTVRKNIVELLRELNLNELNQDIDSREVSLVREVVLNVSIGAEGSVSLLGTGAKVSAGVSLSVKIAPR